MPLLVTGSIGLDTVETPHGRADDVIGGSSVYFSLAAALFCNVRLVGVVGEDFDRRLLRTLEQKGVDTRGVEFRAGSRTFRWHGRYDLSMNERETVGVELNVLTEAPARIPDVYRDSEFVFLANTHPAAQADFARSLPDARLIVCDTMDLWIETEREALADALRHVHGLVLNDGEARLLAGRTNLVTAGRAILDLGPRFVVIKKGEHGSLLVSRDDLFMLPAYPTERTVDPTGCGDTFAGAMMGYLAAEQRDDTDALRGRRHAG
jgi:sugar/nucleoside kinase (ribokinase family)